MRTYDEALEYSKHNPTEVVEFFSLRYLEPANSTKTPLQYQTGFFLNGKHEGTHEYYNDVIEFRNIYHSKTGQSEHLCFWTTGIVENRYYRKNDALHGEWIWFYKDGAVRRHRFYIANKHVKKLDYLLNAERDSAFYETLALYDIGKEYTFN